MVNLVSLLVVVATAVSLRSMLIDNSAVAERKEEVVNGASWSLNHYLLSLAKLYGIPFGQQFISLLYGIYLRLTFFNLVIFLLKYVPTAFYMYKFVKNIYVTSRERLIRKQTELEDIQLKIQIVNTKLCVRDAEFNERADMLRREKERLRRLRSRVREVIAADDACRRALEAAADCDADLDMHVNVHITPQEDNDFITELLKGLKGDTVAISDRLSDKMDCGEYASEGESEPENSIYSSLSDMDVRQDCRVKIVKVTNVYKVAYLKHYIKQKRLRRANKRALLKKKMENMKKLMEDWQKTLSMVINRTIMNIDTHPIDVASQEAMGDYSKPRDSSSDSDLRNYNDSLYDEYSLSWTHNPYRPYAYNYEDVPETAVSRDYYSDQDIGDGNYAHVSQCECIGQASRNITSIKEETGSQMAIEENTSEADDEADCRDLVAI